MTQTQTNVTETLATHALSVNLEALPDAVVRHSKVVLTDTVGVLLAASQTEAVQLALRAFPLTPGGQATVLGHSRGATPEQAAFINGLAGHNIELDDSHSPSRTHAASVIVSAALAAAEAAGGCSGPTLLGGIVAAYDVQVRLSKALGVFNTYDSGFHPSSLVGSVGASVAAGYVLGLSVEQMQTSIALGASQASGLLIWMDEPLHMVKSFDTGMAARNGLYSAQLAKIGFQGPPDALGGRYNILKPFRAPEGALDRLVDALGERYDITDSSIKRHACGGQDSAAVDGLLALRDAHGFGWDEIESIDVQLSPRALHIVDQSLLINVNIQYLLAVAAHVGVIRLEHFGEEWIGNPDVRRLADKVTVRGNEELSINFPNKKGAIVTVVTGRGTFTTRYAAPRGNPDEPLTNRELSDKFLGLAATVLDEHACRELWELLNNMDAQSSTDRLFELVVAQA